jgi:hypothetical protein
MLFLLLLMALSVVVSMIVLGALAWLGRGNRQGVGPSMAEVGALEALAAKTGALEQVVVDGADLSGDQDGRAWTVGVRFQPGRCLIEVEIAVHAPDSGDVRERVELSPLMPTLGDDALDAAFVFDGDPPWLSAAFDPTTRALWSNLAQASTITLHRGTLRLRASLERTSAGTPQLEALVLEGLALGAAISTVEEDVPRALFAHHAEGAGASSRLAGLRLIARCPEDAVTRTMAEGLRLDGDLGALAALIRGVPGAEGDVIKLLQSGERDVISAAIACLGAVGTVDAVRSLDVLAGIYERDARGAATAIQARVDPGAQGGLALEAEGGGLALEADRRARGAISTPEGEG